MKYEDYMRDSQDSPFEWEGLIDGDVRIVTRAFLDATTSMIGEVVFYIPLVVGQEVTLKASGGGWFADVNGYQVEISQALLLEKP